MWGFEKILIVKLLPERYNYRWTSKNTRKPNDKSTVNEISEVILQESVFGVDLFAA